MTNKINIRRCFALAAITGISSAAQGQVLGQREYAGLGGTQFIERTVMTKDRQGIDTSIVQVLRKLEDGSLQYRPAEQPEATRTFDRKYCEGHGKPLSDNGVATWGHDTIHGYFCSREYDSVEEMLAEPVDHDTQFGDPEAALDAKLIDAMFAGVTVVESFAPGGYMVPRQINSIHHGKSRYFLATNAYLSHRIVVDNRCMTSASDYTRGGIIGYAQIRVNCYMPVAKTAPTLMTTCASGLCHNASNTFVVF